MSKDLDKLLDRYNAAGDVGLCIFALEIALVLWLRVLRAPRRSTISDRRSVAGPDVEAILKSLAIAFAALFVRLAIVSAGRYGWLTWGSLVFDILLLASTLSLIAAAVWCIRASTRSVCGWSAVVWFGMVPAAIGSMVAIRWS